MRIFDKEYFPSLCIPSQKKLTANPLTEAALRIFWHKAKNLR